MTAAAREVKAPSPVPALDRSGAGALGDRAGRLISWGRWHRGAGQRRPVVEPYRPINTLKRVADGIWIVDGPIIAFRYFGPHPG